MVYLWCFCVIMGWETALYHFGTGHGECNVHLGRYLCKNTEETSNHLLFLYDFRVHYSNNMSEEDLRICKNRNKMGGGFRNASGCKMYCRIMSFIETVKHLGLNIYQSIMTLMDGKPVIY